MTPKPLVILLFAAACAVGVSACTPVTSYNGFQAREEKPGDLKIGEDTKSTVLTKLGSPSQVATFEPNIWFYISQVTDKYAYYNPRMKSRDVVAVTFGDDEKVKDVKSLTMKNGYQIAYSKRETPTRGRELTVLEQLLGNVGRGGTGQLPPQDDPGSRPGGGGGLPR
jgi:outer membrane protein assembly factor BamE (lipoprotein component of BamABCDE complex)